MKLELESVRWQNFNSYGHMWTEVQLNRNPLTVIEGKTGDGKSNGAGKCLDFNTEIEVKMSKETELKYKEFLNHKHLVILALDKIANIETEKYNEVYSLVMRDIDAYLHKNKVAVLTYIKNKYFNNSEFLNNNKKSLKGYWIIRGYSDEVVDKKVNENIKFSPFDYKYWMEKESLNESDAKYKANSIRPIKKEYWIEKGYTESESIKLAKEAKDKNNKKGNDKSCSRDESEFKKTSPRCVEYWLNLGYSEEDANKKVSETQSTFSYNMCIDKHGELEGKKIFNDRQEKWQNTLNSKTDDELYEINMKKGRIEKPYAELLYIISIEIDGENYIKIGVTTNLENRLLMYKNNKIKLLKLYEGETIYKIEQEIFSLYSHTFHPRDIKKITGYTEILDYSCYESVVKYIEERIKE